MEGYDLWLVLLGTVVPSLSGSPHQACPHGASCSHPTKDLLHKMSSYILGLSP